MKRITHPEQLNEWKRKILSKHSYLKKTVVISSGTCGQARGSLDIIKAFDQELEKRNLKRSIGIKVTGCHGFCQLEPNIIIYPEGIFYKNLKPEDVPEIVEETIKSDVVIPSLVYEDLNTGEKYIYQQEIPFYKKQMRLLTENNLKIDPTNIEDYIVLDGYQALANVLFNMTSEEVIDEIKLSGLRGRGGAGFPTGLKWEFVRKSEGDIKYIICNADEGDPGAYMDRSLLEGNPHSIIEGMLIGAYAIGASEGYIYVRMEYPLAVRHITIALEQAKRSGLLGKSILGTEFQFDIHVIKGAGAFVSGEETSLIASIEGRRAFPRQRPPYPAQYGLWGKPTNINNVETWANIPLVINKGANWYSKIGVKKSKGTKIFSLVGKINNTGLVEVPMGITLREIIYDIGGGIKDNKKFKAVQTGGPSGGCIPAEMLDLSIDYDTLAKAGSIIGSGGMIIMDENTCMVDIARYFLNFTQEESCGKCAPCRLGTRQMVEILTRITQGKGEEGDIKKLEGLAKTVSSCSLCGLGQTAPNPVLTTIRYFKDEYEEHIKYKKCPALDCKEIVSSPCQYICPIHQEASVYIALIAHKEFKKAVDIIRKDNPLPAVCGRLCHHPCERACRAGETGDPIAIRALKRFVMDWAIENNYKSQDREKEPKKNKKVAIIGAGPAGLTAGYYLNRQGYQVTIFESLTVPGGMLAIGIPEHRLPKDILKFDIENIINSGITLETKMTLGKDFSIDELFEKGYSAVLIAIGKKPDISFLVDNYKLNVSKWGTIIVDAESFLTNRKGVFAGGDVVTGPKNVVETIAAGKEVAESIKNYLEGKTLTKEYKLNRPSLYIEPVELTEEEMGEAKRPEIPKVSIKNSQKNFRKVETTLTEEMAVKEARRCLRCELETEDAKEAFAERVKK